MAKRTDIAVNELGYISFENGDMKVVEDYNQVIQHIKQRLQTFKGEWFLNSDEGVPYMDYVFIDNPDLNTISTVIKRAIVTTPGVESISEFAMTFDKPSRSLYATFRANGAATLENMGVTL